MIEISDNGAANWVYEHLDSPHDALTALAHDAGMSGLQIDTLDPDVRARPVTDHRQRFRSVVLPHRPAPPRIAAQLRTEPALARRAARWPTRSRTARGPVLEGGLEDETAGHLGSPYIVNQAAQFTYKGTTYGVAVTVGTVSDQPEGEAVVQRIVSALL